MTILVWHTSNRKERANSLEPYYKDDKIKRIISIFLVVCMFITSSVFVFAAENKNLAQTATIVYQNTLSEAEIEALYVQQAEQELQSILAREIQKGSTNSIEMASSRERS